MANDYFYGLEGNKLYKIYVTDMALHGARISSNIYDPKSGRAAMASMRLVGILIGQIMGARAAKKRLVEEAKYDALEAGSPLFREGHKANFSLAGSDVLSATVQPKPQGMKGWLSAGAHAELQLAAGKKRRFLLIEDQDLNTVKGLLAKPVPNTQLMN